MQWFLSGASLSCDLYVFESNLIYIHDDLRISSVPPDKKVPKIQVFVEEKKKRFLRHYHKCLFDEIRQQK